MSDKRNANLLATSLQLQEAADNLSNQTRALDIVRDKITKLERQRAELIESLFGGKDIQGNSLNVSLNHKFKNQKNALLKNQKEFEAALGAYARQLTEFEETILRYNHREADDFADAISARFCSGALHRAFEGIVKRLVTEAKAELPESDFELPEDSHDYIPFPIQKYLDALIRVDGYLSLDPDYADPSLRYRPVAFLEMGCATGRNLLLTKLSQVLLLDRCAGFDLNDHLIAIGQAALGLGDEIFVADAFEFDYSDYDVLFSYRPIRTPEVQSELEKTMVASMRQNAYLIAPMAESLDQFPELQCLNRSLDIWKKTA
ncbi:MAG: class I SAM-dependent methyltransferase [Ruegeria sp.]